MKVLVDTCIWSLALRRKTPRENTIILQLRELIDESRVQMLGPIRQEILSGIPATEHFDSVRKYLAAFKDQPLVENDYEVAAELYNVCRKKGIQGSNTDFLICAAAINYKMAIFTSDNDFALYAKSMPIKLMTVS